MSAASSTARADYLPAPTGADEQNLHDRGGRRFSAHVRSAPPLEPPYDPLEPPPGPQLHLVAPIAEPLPFDQPLDRPAGRRHEPDHDFWGPQPTSRRLLPDPRPQAHRFVQATLEALAGRRPPAQLQQWTSPSVYAEIVRGRRTPPAGTRAAAPAVTSVHVSEPADGVAEVAAVIRRDGRFHAVAAKLQGVDGRWRCVALQIG